MTFRVRDRETDPGILAISSVPDDPALAMEAVSLRAGQVTAVGAIRTAKDAPLGRTHVTFMLLSTSGLEDTLELDVDVMGASGTLDASFGTHGLVTFDALGLARRPLHIQPDGNLLVLQQARSGQQITVGRRDADGHRNSLLVDEGASRIFFSGFAIPSFAVDSAGGILVAAGIAADDRRPLRLAMMKLDASGMPDLSFGTPGSSGRAELPLDGPDGAVPVISSVVALRDGSFVLGGVLVKQTASGDVAPDDYEALLRHVTKDGTLGPPMTAAALFRSISSIEAHPSGDLVIAGWTRTGEAAVALVARSGELVTSFGTKGSGVATVPWRQTLGPGSVALAPDGKLALAGTDDDHAALSVLLPNGDVDTSFGESGTVRGTAQAPAGALAVTRDALGRFVLAGYEGSRPLLERRLASGASDMSFGVSGAAPPIPAFAGDTDDASWSSATLDSAGRIVVTGSRGAPPGDLVIARYWP